MDTINTTRVRLNPTQACKYLRLSYGKLMKMVRNMEIPNFRLGNRVYFFKDSIDEWLDSLERKSFTA
jgi:excisionase family DNA binding protein